MFHKTENLTAEESSSSGVVSNLKSHNLHIRRGLFTQDRGPKGVMFSLTDTEDDVQFDSECTPSAILYSPFSWHCTVFRVWGS